MNNIFAFLFRFRGALVFAGLEIFAFYLYVTSSSYHRAAFFSSANQYAGMVLERRTQITDYFRLDELNRQLVRENALLRQQLYRPDTAGREAARLPLPPLRGDSLHRVRYRPAAARPDTLLLGAVPIAAHDPAYPLVPARVVNATLRDVDNYLTLNAGAADGVQPGQGVVAAAGVVGRVMVVSPHYATVTSLLHSKTSISAKLKRDGTFGSIKWLGDDPTHVLLDYIPRQNRVQRGDSVVTSGYNAIFPEGVFIGTVDSFVKEPDKNFWTVQVRTGVNFSNLTYVYVVRPRPKAERDTLEARTGLAPGKEGPP